MICLRRKTLLSLFFLIICLQSYQTASANEKEILDLFSIPEAKIDVGRAALIIAKDFHPKLDVAAYSAKIDEWAQRALKYSQGSKDPDMRIRSIITIFYKEGIKYDFSDPYLNKLSNKYINGLIDTKRGACVTMPTLFLAIAQRLGYPIHGIKAPDHYFLRYVDQNYKESNIDITAGGGYAPDEDYIRQFSIPKKAIESGEYLRPLKHREMIADLVAGAAIEWAKRGDIKRAIRYLEHCKKVFQRSGGINDVLGHAYLKLSEDLEGNDAKEMHEKGAAHIERAKELGFTRLPMEEYAKKLKTMSNNELQAKKGGK